VTTKYKNKRNRQRFGSPKTTTFVRAASGIKSQYNKFTVKTRVRLTRIQLNRAL